MLEQEEALSRKFIRRGFWLYFFTFLTAPLAYTIKVILARDLPTVHDFGLFYGLISLVTLLSALNDLWCTESLNYFLPKHIIKKDYGRAKYLIRIVFFAQMISSCVILWGFFLLADFLAIHHFHDPQAAELLKVFGFFFLWVNLLQIATTIFSAAQDTKLQKGTDFFRMSVTVGFIIGLFFFEQGTLYTYALAWIGWVFLSVLFAFYYAYKRYYRVYFLGVPIVRDRALRKTFLLYAFPTFLTANIGLLFSQIDAQLVTFLLGNEAQGYYSNYLSILSIPFLVIAPIVGFLFPVITELHTRERWEKMQHLHETLTLVFIIIAIWISVFMFQVGTPFTVLFFGEKYTLSGYILQFSAPFLIFNLLNQINFQFLSGTGKAWWRTISMAIALPINIILNIVLIQKFGVAWSALAVGISWIPLYLCTWYFTRSFQKIPRIQPILLNLFACGFGAVLLWGIQSFVPLGNFTFLFLAICVYFCIFSAVNFSLLREGITLIKTHTT